MSHQWKSQRMGGNPANAESYEIVCYCTVCGAEYSEDDDLPPCSEEIQTTGEAAADIRACIDKEPTA